MADEPPPMNQLPATQLEAQLHRILERAFAHQPFPIDATPNLAFTPNAMVTGACSFPFCARTQPTATAQPFRAYTPRTCLYCGKSSHGSGEMAKLFGDILPDRFGTLGSSLYTLFQMMTLESWSEANVRPILEHQPLAWMFFVPFILVATFVVLNLFIGVIVDSIQTLRAERESADSRAAREASAAASAAAHADQEAVIIEIRALRSELAALRAGAGGR